MAFNFLSGAIKTTNTNFNVSGYILPTELEKALGNPSVDGQVLASNTNGVRYWTSNISFAYTANNSNYANSASLLGGIPEANLNVNSAIFSTNALFAYTANNSNYANSASLLGGKLEANLNVNSSVFSTNALFAYTANNSTYFANNLPSYYTNATNINAGTLNEARLPSSGVTAGRYGNSSSIPVLTIDQYGRVNTATVTAVAGVTAYSFNNSNNTFTITTGDGSNFSANLNSLSNLSVSNAISFSGSATVNSSVYTGTANNAYHLGGNLPEYYTNANNISTGTLAEARLPFRMNQNVTSSSNVEFHNVVLTGTLSVANGVTIITANNFSIADNMIYFNNGILATITNVSGNGTYVTFTANNNFRTGWDVYVSGVDPDSWNGLYHNIIFANATHFQANSSNNFSYTSGGSARGKTDVNPDLGFAAGYNDGTYHHAGFFRDHDSGTWKVFDSYTPEPDNSIYIDQTHPSFRLSNFMANNVFVGNNTVFATINSTSFSGTANNATYAFGQSSALSLNVNSAVYSTNAEFAYIANNANLLGGKLESELRVYRADYAGSATSADSALDSGKLNGKTEGNLSVNNANTSTYSNNASYLEGKPQANLDVNSAVYSTNSNFAYTANNANYLGGYTWNSPAAIGGTTANSGNFNTVNATSYTVGNTFVANSTYLLTTGRVRIANGGISANAWTTNGIGLIQSNATYKDLTSNNVTVAAVYVNLFDTPTITASNTIYTLAYNTYFKNPVAGTNTTITSAYALGADTIEVPGNASFTLSTTGAKFSVGSAQGSNGIEIGGGGTGATGQLTFGRSTGTQTTTIQAANTISGNTKTINFGTGGLAGSNTIITIGTASGGQSNVIVNGTMTVNGAIIANGSIGFNGHVLLSTGNGVYWSSSANNALFANNANYLGGLPSSVYTTTSGTIENANKLNNEPASYYTNATNITTGTLQGNVIPSYVVNTSGNFTISGLITYNSNLTINNNGALIFNANSKIYDASGSRGTQGQFLSIDASNNISWSTFAVTSVSNANNANNLNNKPASYYTNATNINTGTLPYAQLGPNVVNTTANFTYSANIILSSTSALVFNTGAKIYDTTGSQGSEGQILASNGAGNVYWTSLALLANNDLYINTTASYTFGSAAIHTHNANIVLNNNAYLKINYGAGIVDSSGVLGTTNQILTSNGTNGVYWSTFTGGLLSGNGLSSNTTHMNVNANTGLIANTTGLFINTNVVTTTSATQQLTNKRITPRVNTQTSTTTINANTQFDIYVLTAQTTGLTINLPVDGSAEQGEKLIFRIYNSSASPQNLTVSPSRQIGVSMTPTLASNKLTYIGCINNSVSGSGGVKWDIVAFGVETP